MELLEVGRLERRTEDGGSRTTDDLSGYGDKYDRTRACGASVMVHRR